jgi:hypothetical protein
MYPKNSHNALAVGPCGAVMNSASKQEHLSEATPVFLTSSFRI